MTTYEFIVALATNAGAPFAFSIGAVAAAIAAPIVIGGLRRSADRRHEISAERDVDIKRIEASVRNGAVALTKPARENYDG
jgi:hypothetical protein